MGIRKRNYASGSIWNSSELENADFVGKWGALFLFFFMAFVFGYIFLGYADRPHQQPKWELPPKIKTRSADEGKRLMVSRHSTSNVVAPNAPRTLDERNQYDYIKRFRATAQTEERKYGVPACISLAQGILESRAGQSKIVLATKNHFGMKCFDKNCADGHCMNIKSDGRKDFFRQYNTDWESWRSHSQLLAGRYKSLVGKDWQGWAEGLERLGYADDARYAETLGALIRRWKLAPTSPSSDLPQPLQRRGVKPLKGGGQSTASILME